MKQKALFMALSSKIKDKEYIILDNVKFENGKTKEAKSMFDLVTTKLEKYKKTKSKQDSLLMILPDNNNETRRAVRNLSFAKTISAKSLNVSDILSHKYLLLLKDSVGIIKETYKR